MPESSSSPSSPNQLRQRHVRQELMKLPPRSSLEQMIREWLIPLHGLKAPLFRFQVRQAGRQSCRV
uniref:Uncharacterized protein n=1 Tax=Piliocolobus tephrosceles TaxID=591936 RepID=A0A8C9GQ99_9PRIM